MLRRLAVVLVVLLVLALAPVLAIETVCNMPVDASTTARAPAVIQDPRYKRPEANSYLSYPEWYIVHAYEDFAAEKVAQGRGLFGLYPATDPKNVEEFKAWRVQRRR